MPNIPEMLIAHYKVPDTVEVLEVLPKTSTGKIQKIVLRERDWANEAVRVKG